MLLPVSFYDISIQFQVSITVKAFCQFFSCANTPHYYIAFSYQMNIFPVMIPFYMGVNIASHSITAFCSMQTVNKRVNLEKFLPHSM